MPMSDFNPPADVVTELANLREDCAASGAEIARLRDEVAGLHLERTVLMHALAQVVAFTQGQRRRGNTYRRRAQSQLAALRERIASLCASVDTSVAVWGPTATVQLGTVADWLKALTPPAETFTPAELEQMTRAYEG